MNFFISAILILVISGCAAPQPEQSQITCEDKPWVKNPNMNDKIGAVGIAMQTLNKKISTQRKLAITRALDELTRQNGVGISAHMEAACIDKNSNKFFVWMVID